MTWHWTGLAVFSLTLLPAGLALLTGRIPHRLHACLAPATPARLGPALPVDRSPAQHDPAPCRRPTRDRPGSNGSRLRGSSCRMRSGGWRDPSDLEGGVVTDTRRRWRSVWSVTAWWVLLALALWLLGKTLVQPPPSRRARPPPHCWSPSERSAKVCADA